MKLTLTKTRPFAGINNNTQLTTMIARSSLKAHDGPLYVFLVHGPRGAGGARRLPLRARAAHCFWLRASGTGSLDNLGLVPLEDLGPGCCEPWQRRGYWCKFRIWGQVLVLVNPFGVRFWGCPIFDNHAQVVQKTQRPPPKVVIGSMKTSKLIDL